jgi:hypothetical protein
MPELLTADITAGLYQRLVDFNLFLIWHLGTCQNAQPEDFDSLMQPWLTSQANNVRFYGKQ